MQEQQHNQPAAWQLNCPVPTSPDAERVTLAHGEGGRLSRKFIRERIVRVLENEALTSLDDAARLPATDGPLAVTTDSFVVSPLFFPGGDIGSLALFGTINDLAVNGAKPIWITLAFIIEEGLPIEVFDRILAGIAEAAQQTGTTIVAGDTKVVPRGVADGLFINTTGIGELVTPAQLGPASLSEGDELVVSGAIGRHGIAVLSAREELDLEPPPRSDSAPLLRAVEVLRQELGSRVRSMRDATRGGVAAVLHEWAEASGQTLSIDERSLPVSAEVRGACELLGLDPLHVANEGTMVIAVEQGAGDDAVAALRTLPETSGASVIGRVAASGPAPVTIRRTLGPEQPLDDPWGAPLPRIC